MPKTAAGPVPSASSSAAASAACSSGEVVSQGQAVNVRILEIDGERRRLSLSLKRVEEGEQPVPRADGAESVHEMPDLKLSEEAFPAAGPATVEADVEEPDEAGAPEAVAEEGADEPVAEAEQPAPEAEAEQPAAEAVAEPRADEQSEPAEQAEETEQPES